MNNDMKQNTGQGEVGFIYIMYVTDQLGVTAVVSRTQPRDGNVYSLKMLLTEQK